MTLGFIIGSMIAMGVFLSLAVMWTVMSAPLLFYFSLLFIPVVLAFALFLGPLAIVWGWFYEEQEILGTEPDAVPG